MSRQSNLSTPGGLVSSGRVILNANAVREGRHADHRLTKEGAGVAEDVRMLLPEVPVRTSSCGLGGRNSVDLGKGKGVGAGDVPAPGGSLRGDNLGILGDGCSWKTPREWETPRCRPLKATAKSSPNLCVNTPEPGCPGVPLPLSKGVVGRDGV